MRRVCGVNLWRPIRRKSICDVTCAGALHYRRRAVDRRNNRICLSKYAAILGISMIAEDRPTAVHRTAPAACGNGDRVRTTHWPTAGGSTSCNYFACDDGGGGISSNIDELRFPDDFAEFKARADSGGSTYGLLRRQAFAQRSLHVAATRTAVKASQGGGGGGGGGKTSARRSKSLVPPSTRSYRDDECGTGGDVSGSKTFVGVGGDTVVDPKILFKTFCEKTQQQQQQQHLQQQQPQHQKMDTLQVRDAWVMWNESTGDSVYRNPSVMRTRHERRKPAAPPADATLLLRSTSFTPLTSLRPVHLHASEERTFNTKRNCLFAINRHPLLL